MQRSEISVVKRKDIHFRIEEKLIEETVIHNALFFHHATPITNYISSMFPSLNIPDNIYLHAEMKEWLKEEIESVLSLHNGIWRYPKTIAIYQCKKEKS